MVSYFRMGIFYYRHFDSEQKTKMAIGQHCLCLCLYTLLYLPKSLGIVSTSLVLFSPGLKYCRKLGNRITCFYCEDK